MHVLETTRGFEFQTLACNNSHQTKWNLRWLWGLDNCFYMPEIWSLNPLVVTRFEILKLSWVTHHPSFKRNSKFTFLECFLIRLVTVYGTYRGFSGDSEGTNTKTVNLMIKLYFESISLCVSPPVWFNGGTNIQKIYMGASTTRQRGPVAGSLWDKT